MTLPHVISEATRLARAGDKEQSAKLLREFLCSQPRNVEALLWLAKVSTDGREAQAAAELALALDPANEVAQRAVATVHNQEFVINQDDPEFDVLRLTGMTLQQARAAIWPFKGANRPLGILLDEGKVALKDLGFAVEKAYDATVQKAARTVLLANLLGNRLHEPPLPIKFLEGRSYAVERERLSIRLEGLAIGFMLVFSMVLLLLLVFGVYLTSVGPAWPPIGSLIIFMVGLLMVCLWRPGTRLIDELYEQGLSYRRGAEAERKVVDLLRASLSAPWVLFQNVRFPERKWGDVDLVLVGPGGMWAFEVKAYRSRIRNVGDRWEYKGKRGWRKLSKHPGQQAQRNAQNIRTYLETHGVRIQWVNAVVVWAGADELLTVDDPTVPVWRLTEFSERLEEMWQKQRLDEEQIAAGAKVLEEVIQKDKAQTAKP